MLTLHNTQVTANFYSRSESVKERWLASIDRDIRIAGHRMVCKNVRFTQPSGPAFMSYEKTFGCSVVANCEETYICKQSENVVIPDGAVRLHFNTYGQFWYDDGTTKKAVFNAKELYLIGTEMWAVLN